MVYQVPAVRKSKDQNKFEFTLDGKKIHTLPSMKLLSPAATAELESGKLHAVRALFEKYAPGVFDQLESNEQLEALSKAWAEESGIDLGELGASAGS